MTSTLLKYNVILIVLCIRMTLIHNASVEKVKTDIILYYDPQSPQSRSVLLTLEALNLEVNFKPIDELAQVQIDQHPPLNSLHTIPVIEDGDFFLSYGHAIITYLVRKYGEKDGEKDDHPLYPKNPKIKAQINQLLQFDNGTLYPAFRLQYNEWIFHRIPKTNENEDKIHEALEFLENVLKKSTWTAGESMTVADFSLVASISTFKLAGVDLKKYVKINEWLTKCWTKMDGYTEANQAGINKLEKTIQHMDAIFTYLPQMQCL